MTALAGPKPTPLDPSAFGRQHDDRAPLLFAAGAAVVIHFLAILIPLPDTPQPVTPPSSDPPLVLRPILRPPDLPKRPVRSQPEPEHPVILVPLPLPEPPEPTLVLEPEAWVEEPGEIAEVSIEFPLGQIEPPPPAVGYVEQAEPGLVLPVGIYKPEPEFPELARQIRRSGRVVLRAVVDAGGSIKDIEVVFAPDPDLGFSAAAVRAVARWRYKPGELRGRAVSVRLTVVVDFNLY